MRGDKQELKHLRFLLTVEEYADFWYIASLLNLNKKKATLLKMMAIIKDLSENEKL